MIAVDLLEQARACGVTLTPLPDGRLKLKGKPRIPTELTAAVREHKSDILALLQSCTTLVELYTQYWNTPETEPMATFVSLHREIDILERQVGVDTAWRILEAAARAWYQEKGACPFCKLPGVLHLTTEATGDCLTVEG